MPIFEMPLAELRTYTGRSPKPADFDEFWSRALKELASTDLQIELKPAQFTADFAECFDLYFSGVGGARIHAMYLRPKTIKGALPAVLRFHGYNSNSGDWYDKLGYVASGYAYAAMDCRGQGGSSEDVSRVTGSTLHGHIIRGLQDGPDHLLFRQVYLDTVQLARVVMSFDEVDSSRIGVTGGSQGGGLSLACAALEPSVKMLAPVYPFLCDFRRVWEMDLAKAAYEELTTYFRQFDPLHLREEDTFTRLGYIDVQHLADRIKGHVLFITGLMDTVCPPSTQFAAYNKIRSPKEMLIYPDYGHETLPGSADKIYQFFKDL
ncbi:MAG TPA: alpha/beta fold hydrolase [Candidatus Dormibacteraeota bacterium]|nr:alpha/beta fold hydrolase [Candidatus Dormibacteraeota bacterium]